MRIITSNRSMKAYHDRVRRENTPPPLLPCRGGCGKEIRIPYYGKYGERLCWDCFKRSCPEKAKKYYPSLWHYTKEDGDE